MAVLEGGRLASYEPKNNQNFSNRKRNSEARHQSEKAKQILYDWSSTEKYDVTTPCHKTMEM